MRGDHSALQELTTGVRWLGWGHAAPRELLFRGAHAIGEVVPNSGAISAELRERQGRERTLPVPCCEDTVLGTLTHAVSGSAHSVTLNFTLCAEFWLVGPPPPPSWGSRMIPQVGGPPQGGPDGAKQLGLPVSLKRGVCARRVHGTLS